MPWIFFSLISICCVSVGNILQKSLLSHHRSNPHTQATALQLLTFLILLVVTLWKGITLPPLYLWWSLILMGVLYGVGTLCLFEAVKKLESSYVTILTSVRVPITMVTAALLIGQHITLTHVFGTILILVSLILVSLHKMRHLSSYGVMMALSMAVCYGLAVTNDTYILSHFSDVYSYTTIAYLMPGIFLVCYRPSVLRSLSQEFGDKRTRTNFFLMCLLYAVATLGFFTAIDLGGTAGQVSAINQASVVLTVLLAALFLGEKGDLWRKLLAAIGVVLGVMLLR